MNIVVFILILAVLVLVHEFGHFILAKKNGILVEEFGFGFPPRLFGKKIGETLYSINLFPIGGFVKLHGEEYEDIGPGKRERTFAYKKPWQKTLVIIGGVIGNFMLGWVLISYLFTQGVPVPVNTVLVEKTLSGGPAQQAGLQPKDEIIKLIVLGKKQETATPADKKTYTIQKGDTLWTIAETFYSSGYFAYDIARTNHIINPNLIHQGNNLILPELQNTALKFSPAVSKIKQQPNRTYAIKTTNDLIALSKQFEGIAIQLVIIRNHKNFTVSLTPRKNPPKGQGPLGIVITSFIEKRYPWYQAPISGLAEAFSISKKIIVELVKIIVRFVTLQKPNVEVTGPIGIARYTSEAMRFGSNALLELIALLSLNLAIINILPFPALDGGRLVLILYEWMTKKRVNKTIERYLNLAGFFVLIILAISISIHDIIKIYK